MKNTIRRYATAALIATGIAGSAVVAASPANAWSGCEGDCVNTVKVTQLLATKATARLQFTTAVPSKIQVTVKQVGGSVVGATNSPSTQFLTSFDLWTGEVLSQGKGYIVYLKATDQNGKSYTEQVSVTALSRTVKLTLNGIKITEDSDVGAGELRAGISVGGTVSTIFGTTSITATKTLYYSKVITAQNVAFGAKVAVEIQDDDVDWGEWCTNGTGFSFTSGSTSCIDWTTGSANMSSMSSSPGTRDGTFEFYADGRLDFKVWGTYSTTVA